jgi:hypothetical protein
MTKSYRFLVAALLISLIAGSAFAMEKGQPAPHYTLTEVDAADSPSGRDVYILSYDFSAAPIDYIYGGLEYGSQGILPSDATMVGFGFDNITFDVYQNDGASFSNWALECWIGCTFDDLGSINYVGIAPSDVADGPGTFGPYSNYFALNPADWPMPDYAPFAFFAQATWDDGTGLPAGTIHTGTVYAEIETSAVGTDEATMSQVKALYR